MTNAYQEATWNTYAETHASVLPSVQLEVYRTSNSQLEPPPVLSGGFVLGSSMKAIK